MGAADCGGRVFDGGRNMRSRRMRSRRRKIDCRCKMLFDSFAFTILWLWSCLGARGGELE